MAEQGDLFAPGVAEAGAAAPPAPKLAPPGDLLRRFADYGVDALDEGDTLTLVLARCLSGRADPEVAADALLARFGAAEADLAREIGAPAARELTLLHALLLRTLAYPLRHRSVLSSTESVRAYVRARLAASPREAFHVLFLDKKNALIADERLGQGSVDHAPVYPREVVRRALELSASAILLVHNHPSGDATPSSADVAMTKQIVEAARALGLAVHDHFIVAGDQVASLRALGLM